MLEVGCAIPNDSKWGCLTVCLEDTKEGKVEGISVPLLMFFELPDISFFKIRIKQFGDQSFFIILVTSKNFFLTSPDCKSVVRLIGSNLFPRDRHLELLLLRKVLNFQFGVRFAFSFCPVLNGLFFDVARKRWNLLD